MDSRVDHVESESSDDETTQLIHDLTQLEQVTPQALLQVLQQRFEEGQTYTQIGSRILLSFNPNDFSENFDAAVLENYYQEYKSSSSNKHKLAPHVYQLASKVYFQLSRSGIDQSVVFYGNSGSGKTRNLQYFLKELAKIRSGSQKESKLYEQLAHLEEIFESFGSSMTTTHKYATQFGKYFELQFDSRGKTIGAKVLDYLLQKSRVTNTVQQESNFHVFYQMLAGLNQEEKGHFHLQESSNYQYLQKTITPLSQSELANKFNYLKTSLKKLGFHHKYQSQMFQILAAILHLGNVTFINSSNQVQEAAMVKNDQVLNIAADFLGILPSTLENILTYKTKLIKNELCTLFLDATQAASQRDDLAKCLYSLLFSWIIEYVNIRLCRPGQDNFIGLLDMPGFQRTCNQFSFETFCTNYACERIYQFMTFQVFEANNQVLIDDGIQLPTIPYHSNQPVIDFISGSKNSLFSILNKQANRIRGPATDALMLQSIEKTHNNKPLFQMTPDRSGFIIQHFSGPVSYNAEGFMEKNMDPISPDFVFTFNGKGDIPVGNPFVSGLFNSEAVTIENHPKNTQAIVAAQQPTIPHRKPSMKRPRVKLDAETDEPSTSNNVEKKKVVCATSHFKAALDELFDTFENTDPWFVINLEINQDRLSDLFDINLVAEQIRARSLVPITQSRKFEYTVCHHHDEFIIKYQPVFESMCVNVNQVPVEICDEVQQIFEWTPKDFAIGNQFVYLHDAAWRELEGKLSDFERGKLAPLGSRNGLGKFGPSSCLNGSEFDEQASYFSYNSGKSDSKESEVYINKPENNLQIIEAEESEDEKPPKTKTRKAWICFTWFLTWWIPSFFLKCCGRMKLKDVRMAWREKLALCLCIFFICAAMIFLVVGINPLICPKLDIFTHSELSKLDIKQKAYVSIYGKIYNLGKLGIHHGISQGELKKMFALKIADQLFPRQISSLCNRYDGTGIDPRVDFQNKSESLLGQWANAKYHDHRYYLEDRYDANYYQYIMKNLAHLKVANLAYDPIAIERLGKDQGKSWVIIKDKVYNLNEYATGNLFSLHRENESPVSHEEKNFMDPLFMQLVDKNKGRDITTKFEAIYKGKAHIEQNTMECLKEVFYAGDLDTRNSFRCLFAQYVLLALSVFFFTILFVKFVASLQLGSRPEPEDHDKFVICNVPCYTEDEESLRRTIDSLAVTKYDDKRKLLFVVADGMVIGGGNDLPTPRIVLDILGSDPNLEPESLSFLSLGEGTKQHNMGKVYSGLYQCANHVVPYMVVVKVGKPSERSRPGNRGKRDSQLVLMRFFNKVHFDYPMNPLELEMYHQIKNIIGVDPHFYEYILMVDADTVVLPDSLNRLISAMLHDTKIMGVCGETSLSNEKDTWATMVQVYEYYLSHYLAKSFESLFGTVTCLPGCFSMYRIRAPNKKVPLLVSNNMVRDYSENVVDTLHKKNLLHLGEDRYLTTLMLKHFPTYKMTFTPDAKCLTNAPDTWSVLLSQRRRWINSTIHNLLELVFLPQLCGFCCFSMRFVVFMDLFSTVVLPASLPLLGYMLFILITTESSLRFLSLAFVVAPFVLQFLVFLLRQQWQHVMWLIIYMLALPVFAFFLPVYAFWNFDDFSWGNTRVVISEGKKKKLMAADEGKFDPNTIPVKKWSEYEDELLESSSVFSDSKHSDRSQMVHKMNYNPSVRESSVLSVPPYSETDHQYTNYNNTSFTHLLPGPSPLPVNSQPMPRVNIPSNSVSEFNRVSNFGPQSGGGGSIPLTAMIPQPPSALRTGSPTPRATTYTLNNASFSHPMSTPNLRGEGTFESTSRSGTPMNVPMKPNNPTSLLSSNPNTNQYAPTEAEIIQQLQMILSGANLMQITRKQIRNQLSDFFGGADMSPYSDLINRNIELTLHQHRQQQPQYPQHHKY